MKHEGGGWDRRDEKKKGKWKGRGDILEKERKGNIRWMRNGKNSLKNSKCSQQSGEQAKGGETRAAVRVRPRAATRD